MSSPIWTPAALSSERRALSGTCWRVVEAQHKVSTLKLVDTLAEQALLEGLIELSKPPVPPECRHLHYLLTTPFRYGSTYYIYDNGYWYQASRWSGPFIAVDESVVPNVIFNVPRDEWVNYPTTTTTRTYNSSYQTTRYRHRMHHRHRYGY